MQTAMARPALGRLARLSSCQTQATTLTATTLPAIDAIFDTLGASTLAASDSPARDQPPPDTATGVDAQRFRSFHDGASAAECPWCSGVIAYPPEFACAPAHGLPVVRRKCRDKWEGRIDKKCFACVSFDVIEAAKGLGLEGGSN